MGSTSGPTNVATVAKRSQLVALQDWLTESGEPVQVLCTEVDRSCCVSITGVLPGEKPKMGLPDNAEGSVLIEHTERILKMSAEMIQLGAKLSDPDGALIPAFFFDEAGRTHPLSLDGSKLSERDLMNLSLSTLRCSGYVGGAAEACFLLGERGGTPSGNGAVEVLQNGESDPS